MVKDILKHVLGIDVAQKELVVTLGRLAQNLSIDLYAYKVFKNNRKGFVSLIKWLKKQVDDVSEVIFVMEATGVYHQKFAYYLNSQSYKVSIVLPNKISNYMRTLDTKTITDKTASQAICQFGLERNLDYWEPPKEVYKELKQLVREREQIVQERSIVKNQLHAEKSEAYPGKRSIKRFEARIKFLNEQEKQIKDDIKEILNKEENIELKEEINRLSTIPGVGCLTAVIVLAETNGFELIRNKRQLTSYAGLDVKEKQSGTSVRKKPRISKKGNKYLRKAMHFPALTAIKYSERYKEYYKRLVSKSGIKMKGVVAVQRKLLELIYVMYKNKTVYQENYEQEKRAAVHLETATLGN